MFENDEVAAYSGKRPRLEVRSYSVMAQFYWPQQISKGLSLYYTISVKLGWLHLPYLSWRAVLRAEWDHADRCGASQWPRSRGITVPGIVPPLKKVETHYILHSWNYIADNSILRNLRSIIVNELFKSCLIQLPKPCFRILFPVSQLIGLLFVEHSTWKLHLNKYLRKPLMENI